MCSNEKLGVLHSGKANRHGITHISASGGCLSFQNRVVLYTFPTGDSTWSVLTSNKGTCTGKMLAGRGQNLPQKNLAFHVHE